MYISRNCGSCLSNGKCEMQTRAKRVVPPKVVKVNDINFIRVYNALHCCTWKPWIDYKGLPDWTVFRKCVKFNPKVRGVTQITFERK